MQVLFLHVPRKSKSRLNTELRKQQKTVKSSNYNHLAHVIQSKLFNTDTKGTEPSVRFTEVSVLQSRGGKCMSFGISGTKRTVRNREVSVRRGQTVFLWKIQTLMCYCTVLALSYFEFEGNFRVQSTWGFSSFPKKNLC